MIRFDAIVSFHVRHDVICFKLGKCPTKCWKWRSNSLDCVGKLAVKNIQTAAYNGARTVSNKNKHFMFFCCSVFFVELVKKLVKIAYSFFVISWKHLIVFLRFLNVTTHFFLYRIKRATTWLGSRKRVLTRKLYGQEEKYRRIGQLW